MDGGFANKWHIAMYEDAKVVCSVLEVGPRHCRYVRCPTYRGGSRDAVLSSPLTLGAVEALSCRCVGDDT